MTWIEWNGSQVLDKFTEECSEAMEAAGHVMSEQVLQEIPHDTGYLSESVQVRIDPDNPLTVHVAAGGGGSSGFPVVPYAVKWHEQEANFQKGRKSQYILDPLKQVMPKAMIFELGKKGLK